MVRCLKGRTDGPRIVFVVVVAVVEDGIVFYYFAGVCVHPAPRRVDGFDRSVSVLGYSLPSLLAVGSPGDGEGQRARVVVYRLEFARAGREPTGLSERALRK